MLCQIEKLASGTILLLGYRNYPWDANIVGNWYCYLLANEIMREIYQNDIGCVVIGLVQGLNLGLTTCLKPFNFLVLT